MTIKTIGSNANDRSRSRVQGKVLTQQLLTPIINLERLLKQQTTLALIYVILYQEELVEHRKITAEIMTII